MSTPIDLSGDWEGFYTQHDHRRPITAELAQEGNRLSGTMADSCTDFEMSITELAMEEGLPPGADEQIVGSIREQFPEAPLGPVVAEIHLPESSIIEGDVEDQSVRFIKTYQGEHEAGYRIGGMRMRWNTDTHQVQYQGRLSPNGQEIEGYWSFVGANASRASCG